jgi:hypothetical protein
LVTSEGGGSPEGGVRGGVAQTEGNISEGRRPVVEVGGSWLRTVVGTWAVVGAASMEHISGPRRLGGGRCLEQRQTVGGRVERTRRERWSGYGSGEVKKSGFASEPRRGGIRTRGAAHVADRGKARATGVWPSSWCACVRPAAGRHLSGA